MVKFCKRKSLRFGSGFGVVGLEIFKFDLFFAYGFWGLICINLNFLKFLIITTKMEIKALLSHGQYVSHIKLITCNEWV